MEDYKEKVIALLNSQELSKEQKEKLESIFPELSEDERIRKELIDFLEYYRLNNVLDSKTIFLLTDSVAWLEKQCEHANKVEPKFHEGDWVVNKLGDVWHMDSFDKKNYQVSNGNEYNYFPISKQNEMHLWTVKDAKDGDVLCCKSGWMCIFKALNNHTNTFSPYCFMDRYKWFCNTGSECHTLDKAFVKAYNGEIYPATKEQRELFFKKMNEAGYEWNPDKKELKKIEQKPAVVIPKFRVGDTIVEKEPNGSCHPVVIKYIGKGYYACSSSDDRRHLTFPIKQEDEYKLVEQKPVNKFKPKFKVDDWIMCYYNSNCANSLMKIVKVGLTDYLCKYDDGQSTCNCDYIDNAYRLWTIQDAKDGDVLYSLDSKQPFIYKERSQFSQAIGYCCINKFGEFAIWNTSKYTICTDKYIPATEKQRELLFKKMKEAGYEWNPVKKELKKIEQRMVWNEGNKKMLDNLVTYLDGRKDLLEEVKRAYIDWLKSLRPQNVCAYNPYKETIESIAAMVEKYAPFDSNLQDFYNNVKVKCKDVKEYDSLYPQNGWKPSDEQIEALADALSLAKNCGEESAFDLRTLLEQLKKLRG